MYNNADHIKYSNGFLYGKIIIETNDVQKTKSLIYKGNTLEYFFSNKYKM